MALDLKTLSPKVGGKYQAQAMGVIKITEIKKNEKIWFVKIEGQQKQLKVFPKQAAAFAKPLEEGAEAEAEISVEEEEYQGETTICAYLRSFGGKSQRTSGGGGGGNKAWQPRTPAEYLAGPVSALTIHAFELNTKDGTCNFVEAMNTAKCMFEAFELGLAKLVKSQPQPAAPEPKPEAKAEAAAAVDPEAEKRAERAAFAKSIFKDTDEVNAFKGQCAEAKREYGDVMDAARTEGVTTREQLEEFLAGAQKKAPAKRNEGGSDGGWA